jgi:hypothetical protein
MIEEISPIFKFNKIIWIIWSTVECLGLGRLSTKLSKFRLHSLGVLMEEGLTGEKEEGILIKRGGINSE